MVFVGLARESEPDPKTYVKALDFKQEGYQID